MSDSSAVAFAALGAVEEHPRREVVAEFFKPVFDSRWHKQHVTRTEWMTLTAIAEYAPTRNDYVELVAVVGLLWIGATWRIVLELHRAVLENVHRDVVSKGRGRGRSDRRVALVHDVALRADLTQHPSAGAECPQSEKRRRALY